MIHEAMNCPTSFFLVRSALHVTKYKCFKTPALSDSVTSVVALEVLSRDTKRGTSAYACFLVELLPVTKSYCKHTGYVIWRLTFKGR